MSAIAPVRIDDIKNAMIAGLQPLAQAAAAAVPPQRFTIAPFMGERFDVEDVALRGVAGRTPAVLVAFVGKRPYRSTISGKRKRFELTFLAICISDSHRSKEDRDVVINMTEDVGRLIGNRKLGLPIGPLRDEGVVVVAEHEKLFAYAERFTTRAAVDYTRDPGTDLMLSADGQIVPPFDPAVGPAAPLLTVNGVPGSARYAYDLQVQFSTGLYSDFSPWTAVSNAPNTLGGGNTIGVTWSAVPGALQYRLRRRWTPTGGPTVGVIYTGTGTSFTDNGSVAGDGNVTPARGLNFHEDF